jgi:hypothetical protein
MAKSQKPSRSWWSRYAPATKSDLKETENRLAGLIRQSCGTGGRFDFKVGHPQLKKGK